MFEHRRLCMVERVRTRHSERYLTPSKYLAW